ELDAVAAERPAGEIVAAALLDPDGGARLELVAPHAVEHHQPRRPIAVGLTGVGHGRAVVGGAAHAVAVLVRARGAVRIGRAGAGAQDLGGARAVGVAVARVAVAVRSPEPQRGGVADAGARDAVGVHAVAAA